MQALWAGQAEVSGFLLTHEEVGLPERLGRLPQTCWWPEVVVLVMQQDPVLLGIVMQLSAAEAPSLFAGPSLWPFLPWSWPSWIVAVLQNFWKLLAGHSFAHIAAIILTCSNFISTHVIFLQHFFVTVYISL